MEFKNLEELKKHIDQSESYRENTDTGNSKGIQKQFDDALKLENYNGVCSIYFIDTVVMPGNGGTQSIQILAEYFDKNGDVVGCERSQEGYTINRKFTFKDGTTSESSHEVPEDMR